MAKRVFNFNAGPSTLPLPVIQRIQEELLDFRGLGASVIEISHRAPEFEEMLHETSALIRELMEIPENYKVLFPAGGGTMQMAMTPMNLIARKPARKALFVNSGVFSARAIKEAEKYGAAVVVASGEAGGFSTIPELPPTALEDDEASYLHIVSNNTIHATQWHSFPETNSLPLVADATSDIMSRRIDVRKFGMIFAGFQKNLGVTGLSLVVLREDLLGYSIKETPQWLNCEILAETSSMPSTTNTFAVYVCNLVLHWMREQGGVAVLEARNREKSQLIYDVIDKDDFYLGHASAPSQRSMVNVTFNLATPELEEKFIGEAQDADLYALKGHPAARGGVRASMYNAMPLAGAQALAEFMKAFVQRNG